MGVSNGCRMGWNQGPRGRPETPRVYPSKAGAATEGGNLFWARKRRPARLSLVHDRAFPLPEHLLSLAGEFFRPRGADAGGIPPADQAEPAAGRPARARSGPAG